ncbi:hypothetical protein ACWIF8_10520 [Micromonospora chalcea]
MGNVEWCDELGAGQGPSAFAAVDAADHDAAIDLVAQAVAIREICNWHPGSERQTG